ncbi:YdhK family protein [Paenibacillus sp. GCM10023250]|uniref:YdhK family protein n=1 Tax=Paenibacillus sp. GCM10023250 TaxID=3252648 RepID=UPI00361358A8
MKKKALLLSVAAALTLALSACGNDQAGRTSTNAHESMSDAEMGAMNHEGSGEVPAGLKPAGHPAFKAGDKATLLADHMPGMKGAEATIAGAYETTAYAVSYTPATGGAPVTGHKWVVQEEIKDAGDKPYEPGDEVVLEADHMKGMKGAKARIDSAEQTTVYTVDYDPTTGGARVTDHEWVTESELEALK